MSEDLNNRLESMKRFLSAIHLYPRYQNKFLYSSYIADLNEYTSIRSDVLRVDEALRQIIDDRKGDYLARIDNRLNDTQKQSISLGFNYRIDERLRYIERCIKSIENSCNKDHYVLTALQRLTGAVKYRTGDYQEFLPQLTSLMLQLDKNIAQTYIRIRETVFANRDQLKNTLLPQYQYKFSEYLQRMEGLGSPDSGADADGRNAVHELENAIDDTIKVLANAGKR